MPVNRLFCEDGRGSTDIRVLSAILAGIPVKVEPAGGKYELRSKLRSYREAIGNSVVIAGIRDSDFDEDVLSVDAPLSWRGTGSEWLGWLWRRVEIENYLLDPVIVRNVFQTSIDLEKYQDTMSKSAHSIADYTAARIALSRSRIRPLAMSNCWGRRAIAYYPTSSLSR